MDHDEIVRLYGPWLGQTPRAGAELFAGYTGRWWIAGGWALEAFSGVTRPHDDLDIGIPVTDVPLVREHLRGRLDVWAAFDGALKPVIGPDLPPGCGNLWLRAGGMHPWEYDLLLTPVDGDRWEFSRCAAITRSLDEVLWERDGISYLVPEVQLLHKARAARAKDQWDVETCAPLLGREARRWLREALAVVHPGHPWSVLLAGGARDRPS